MQVIATLDKPCTEQQERDFIVQYNHIRGCQIHESSSQFEALDFTEEEKAEMEAQRIAMLHLTRGDVFRGLLKSHGITRAQIRALIEQMPDSTQEQALAKELALIDFDEALEFYRGVALIDTLGTALGITPEQMTAFFETGDWQKLLVPVQVDESQNAEVGEPVPGGEELEPEEVEDDNGNE